MFQSDKPDNKTSSILGPELEISGDVKVSGSLLIYGKVNGNIESNGAVRTARGSIVTGNISAKEHVSIILVTKVFIWKIFFKIHVISNIYTYNFSIFRNFNFF